MSSQFLEVPSTIVSALSLTFGGVCAGLIKNRDASVVVALGSFAALPGLVWSALVLAEFGNVRHQSPIPPLSGLWILWILAGGAILLSLLIERARSRSSLRPALRWSVLLYVVSWGLAFANAVAATTTI